MGSMGEHPKLPQRGSGWSPGRKWILCVLSSRECISDRQKLLQLQRILTLNRDKFGTEFGIPEQFRVPNDLVIFGTGPQNSGLSQIVSQKILGQMVTLNLVCAQANQPTYISVQRKNKILHRPRSVVWEIIPFEALRASKG